MQLANKVYYENNNLIKVTELGNGKKRKVLNLNYDIDLYEDRMKLLSNNGFFDFVDSIESEGKRNKLYKQIYTYLIRAKDFDKDLEYSFYRDKAHFYNKDNYHAKKLSDIDENESWNPKPGMKLDEPIPEVDYVEDNINNIEEFINRESNFLKYAELFSINNIKLKHVKLILKNLKSDIDDEFLKDNMFEIYNIMLDSCDNEQDVQMINLLTENMSESDIARTIGLTRQYVNKRLKQIYNKTIFG